MSEVKKELPQGWASAEFSEICHLISDNGKKIKQKNYLTEGTYPVIDQGEKEIAGFSNDHSLVFDGDFPIVAFGDHTRRFKKISKKFVVGADGVKLFTPDTKLNFDYILNQLRISKFENRGYSRHFQFIRKLDFKIAPLAEQARIVDKIDELFSSIEAGERAIARARTALTRYRKAVLKAAVTGELTADWRAKNPPSETAQDLLARILKARYSAWEKAELEKLDAKGKARPETEKQWEKFRARYKPPVEPNVEDLPDLPRAWKWVCSDAVCFVTKLAGFEFSDYVKYADDGDLPVVKAGNVAKRDFDTSKMAKVHSDKVASLTRSELFGGEILMVFVGANLGKVAITPYYEKLFLGPNVAVIRNTKEFLSEKYGAMYYESDFGFRLLRDSSVGAAQGSISMGRIRNAAIPIMSLDEQAEIISLVEQEFSKADKAEATLSAQAKQAKALKQAVLKTAFEGRLVPQDPNDEPASELLKRIKEEI